MTTDIPKVYDGEKVEGKWYKYWIDKGFFHAEVETDKPPFCIVIPPPNVTGFLHLGHALDNTLQDILIRWKRMQGFNTLWMPGTDHAGIATQVKVEANLAEEGLSKYDLGREAFLEKVWEWKEEYGGRIISQLKRLGASCDWDRERFTMDEGCSKAVREVFVTLYKKGLIYQGNYIINWCPRCQTALSDIEVEHEDTDGKLYHIKYPIKDGSGYVIVATTRPETMLGDTAVAVNPKDGRYKDVVGKTLVLPVIGREIPVITDDFVDSEFGTGAVKVTPAHDPNDFEMGKRHGLEEVIVIDDKGHMTENAGKYSGYERYDCRKKLVNQLQEEGLLLEIEDHQHSVGHCQRCDSVVEPLVSKQWFVKMKPLAEPALKAVKDGEVKFIPSRFTKVYENWLENVHDWCISRQLWWGHRIPVWYCQDCEEVIVSQDEPSKCSKCDSSNLQQDSDVLDTWFSSALWPFSTMGWPEPTPELEHFYPTSVLVTGYDIIFFWVARMIFMALEFMDEPPFKDVYIHGLIRDAQGQKMSKSLGNAMDPIEIIDEVGADTLRFSLITGNSPGNDMKFYEEKVEGSRNFSNKLWNASRFALMNLADYDRGQGEEIDTVPIDKLELSDKWIISRCNTVTGEVTRHLERYDLGEAARELYDFIWGELCDWYIELIKPRLYGKDTEDSRVTAQLVLASVLERTMRLLHPFMPFITEEIWQRLPVSGESIMVQSWPKVNDSFVNKKAEKDMATLMKLITGIRNMRAEVNVPPGKEIDVICACENGKNQEALRENTDYIKQLASIGCLDIKTNIVDPPEKALSSFVEGVEVYLPLEGMIDIEKEIQRLKKEREGLEKELEKVGKKLANENFLNKAPEKVVQKEKAKKEELEGKRNQVIERLKILNG